MSLSLLLHLDGTHGDTTTIDSSPTGHTITLANGAILSNVQTKFGATSSYFDGANDYLSAADTLTDWSFVASEAFTFDCWLYLPSIPGADSPILSVEASALSKWIVEVKSTGALGYRVYNGSPVAAVNISGGSISATTWTHIALVRQVSGAIDLYINGVSVASTTYSTAILTAGTAPVRLAFSTLPAPLYLNAYIDEARILKGEAAWTAGFTPPTSAYAPVYDVEAEHGTLYSAWVEAEHGTPIYISSGAEHGTLYSAWVEAEHSPLYGAWVEAEHGTPITWLIEAEHGSLLSLLLLVEAEHGSLLSLIAFNPIEAEHGALFAAWVEAQHGSLLTLMPLVEAEHGAIYSSTVTVEAEHGSLLNLLAYNLIQAEHGILYRLGLAPSIDVTDSAILYHNGNRVEIISARIKQDEGDPFWSGSIELAFAADYAAMAIDDSISLQLGAETYALIIDGKEKTRSFGQVSLNLSTVSPGTFLTAPRATPITKTWSAVMARAAAEEALGQVIDWAIPDWAIPDARLAVVSADPLDVARRIVEAAGGILQSKPDGTFKARALFPVSIPAWPAASVDFTLDDDAHNISASELYRYAEIVNQVSIRDTSGDSSQDQTEYIQDENDPLKGTLYVFPRPWRPVTVAHTGHAAVGLIPLGVKYISKTELVEFKAGQSNVARPVFSISSVRWQYTNLGGVSFAETDLTSAVNAYSLAWITYLSRCYAFAVSDTIDETIQFLVMD